MRDGPCRLCLDRVASMTGAQLVEELQRASIGYDRVRREEPPPGTAIDYNGRLKTWCDYLGVVRREVAARLERG